MTFDREFFRRWLVGRRLWLTLGVVFHGILIVAMNIGWFPLIMLGGYLCFLSSAELLVAVRLLTPERLARRRAARLAEHMLAGGSESEAEELQLGRRGDAIVDERWIMLWLATGVALAASRATPIAASKPKPASCTRWRVC